ncbi:MAG: tetratricopeptide repeat protein [Smithella sp.]|jgi:tetratricopeptide (TPR) repeat protein
MNGKVVKSKKGETGLIETGQQSNHHDRVQPGLAQTTPVESSFTLNDWLFFIALIAAVFLVYQPAWHGGFIWDDDFFVTRPELRSWYGLFHIWFSPNATLGYYPLLHSVFWVQSWLWGDATLGYHLVNILLHTMAAVMVAIILRRLEIPGAYLAAAIFALHPVHVESVAWISELKNTLSAVFYLGSVMVYLRFDRRRRTSLHLWALLLFVLAMLSKPVTITLPAALLVIFWWQRGRLSWRKDVLPLLPFFLLGAAGAVFTIWTQHLFVTGADVPYFANPAERVLIAGKAIWFYLGKLFWPVELIFIYPRWETSHAAAWQYMFPAAAFALVAALWALRRRWRGPLAGLLFFIGTLFPVLGFFNVFTFVYSFVADHYQYLASLGIITPVAAGIAILLKRLKLWERPAGYAICVLLLLTLAALTWQQSRMYTDIETLWNMTIAKNPACWMAYNNRGNAAYNNLGNDRQAIEDYNRAIEIKPDHAEAYNNRGISYGNLGNYRQAIEDFNKAVEIKPDYAIVYYNRGNAYNNLGNYRQAIEDYNRAIEIKLAHAEAYYNRGISYGNLGNYRQAIEDYDRAIEIKPDYADAYNNRGNIYNGLGNYRQAIEDYNRAIEIKPAYAEAYYNRGVIYLNHGDKISGCRDVRKACELGNCKLLETANNRGLCR